MTKLHCFATLCVALWLEGVSSWSSNSLLVSGSCSRLSLGRGSVGCPPKASTGLSSLAVPVPDDTSATKSVQSSVEVNDEVVTIKDQQWEMARKEGGLFTFNTKYGALNPYAIYYGLTSIFLGIFWFAALSGIQFLYTITGGRIDKRVSSFRVPAIPLLSNNIDLVAL